MVTKTSQLIVIRFDLSRHQKSMYEYFERRRIIKWVSFVPVVPDPYTADLSFVRDEKMVNIICFDANLSDIVVKLSTLEYGKTRSGNI